MICRMRGEGGGGHYIHSDRQVVCRHTSRAISQEVARVWVELDRADVGFGREGEDGVGLTHTPQLDSAVVTARGKQSGLLRVVGHRPHPPAVLLSGQGSKWTRDWTVCRDLYLVQGSPPAHVGVPHTHTTLVVTGHQMVLVVRVVSHTAGGGAPVDGGLVT